MGHDVVELAGDANPFGKDGLPRVLLTLGLELDGLLGQLALAVPQGPDGRAE
jgi:hypothetical protein